MFKSWLRAYEWTLDKVIAYKAVMLAITFATIVGTVWLYIVIPKGFFPTEDTGFMLAITEGADRHARSRPWSRASARSPTIVRADQAVALRQLHRRRRRSQPDHQLRPHVRRAQAEERARAGAPS